MTLGPSPQQILIARGSGAVLTPVQDCAAGRMGYRVPINWKVNATILFALLLILNPRVHAASAPSSCLNSSSTTWTNASFPVQTAQFTATYDATPNQNSMDGVIGFSLNAATGYTSLAAITRFPSTGMIDVRNAGAYSADVAVPYTAGLTYHFRLLISPTTKTYTVYVTPPGGTELTLATNYAFRSEQSTVSSLNDWSLYADIGSESVCNMTISSGSMATPPTISTQPASQTITAGKTATFTVVAAGTAPLTYQWQKNGANIAGATATSYTTPVTATTDSGSKFAVVVSNAAGTLSSSPATLTVNTPSSCLNSSSTTWTNASFPVQTAQFTATYDATPNQNSMDGVIGFSLNAATGYTSLAAITRFPSTGMIDVRNAGAYSADVAVPYTAGLTYHFRLLISPTTKTYTVYVTPPGGTELTLATNYAFRSEQSTVSSLNDWSLYADIGSESVCNMTISSGSMATPPTISTQPASQTITAGKTATFTVVAAGTAPLTYQWQKNGANIAGATATSYTTPVTATTDSGSKFAVVVSNAAGTVTSAAATLTVSSAVAGIQLGSSSITFGNDAVGSNTTQVLTITNTGAVALTISQLTETGSAFSLSGFSLPLNVNAGQQTALTVAFKPTVVGVVSGSISLVSNAPTSPTTVGLTGTGIAATHTLSISPASLTFGNVTTGTSSAVQNVGVTNTGNSSVTISQMTLSGSSYLMTGGSAPVTLSPSQNLALTTQFSPKVAGSMNGSISIVSNATGSPATVTLSGTGVAAVQHSVALTWNESTSAVSGYNVYRGTVSGGPYMKINSSLLGALNYTDLTVQSGTTYQYVTTSVDSSNNESAYSNAVSVTIP